MKKFLPLIYSFLEIEKGTDWKYLKKKKQMLDSVRKMKKCKTLYLLQKLNKI